MASAKRGELWVRGPQVMKGYLNNDARRPAHTIDDEGWLHTGDIGVVDEDGHVSIVDRVKELIKYKGFQVPPAELEALMITHPQVARRGGDRRCPTTRRARCRRRSWSSRRAGLTADELQEFVAEHVARTSASAWSSSSTQIPKSPSGKILRRMLRDRS